MYPLLKKDELGLQYVATTVLWNWLLGSPKRPKSLRLSSLSFIQLISIVRPSSSTSLHSLFLTFHDRSHIQRSSSYTLSTPSHPLPLDIQIYTPSSMSSLAPLYSDYLGCGVSRGVWKLCGRWVDLGVNPHQRQHLLWDPGRRVGRRRASL